MKQLYKNILLSALALIATTHAMMAQDIGQTLAAAEADVTTYLGNYFEPVIKSTSNGLANGWLASGKPHKLFGFDITATISMAGIPDADYNFNFKNSDYNTIRLANGAEEADLPTFAGGATNLQLEAYDASGTTTFDPLDGIDLASVPVVRAGVPVPMANIGFGLPKNTELRVRFIPISNVGEDISVDGSFGIGVLHDIKQWIPGMKMVPIDISAFVGYNQFKFSYQDVDGNQVNFNTQATTIQVVAAKKLLFFTPYLGVGTNIIGSDFSFKATNPDDNSVVEGSFDYSNMGGGRLMIGAQLKILWVLALNVDYTIQKYNTFNIGFGINVR